MRWKCVYLYINTYLQHAKDFRMLSRWLANRWLAKWPLGDAKCPVKVPLVVAGGVDSRCFFRENHRGDHFVSQPHEMGRGHKDSHCWRCSPNTGLMALGKVSKEWEGFIEGAGKATRSVNGADGRSRGIGTWIVCHVSLNLSNSMYMYIVSRCYSQ